MGFSKPQFPPQNDFKMTHKGILSKEWKALVGLDLKSFWVSSEQMSQVLQRRKRGTHTQEYFVGNYSVLLQLVLQLLCRPPENPNSQWADVPTNE